MAERLGNVQLEGDQDLLAALQEMGTDVPRNAVPAAVRKAASWLAAQIQLNAPVGGGRGKDPHAGQLAASIFVRGSRKRASVAMRYAAYYWRFLERGWFRGGSRHHFPFVEPVVKSQYQHAAQIVIDQVTAALNRATARRAKRLGS
jgi:HK97 gp10 family phage protein